MKKTSPTFVGLLLLACALCFAQANAQTLTEDSPKEKTVPEKASEIPEGKPPVASEQNSSEKLAKKPVEKIQEESALHGESKAEEKRPEVLEYSRYEPTVFKPFLQKTAELYIPRRFRQEWLNAGVPKKALNNVLSYLCNANLSKISNFERIIIIDFMKPSTEQRLFILNTRTGAFAKRFATHGKNSGNLYATKFDRSTIKNSLQTTPGFHVVAEVYNGDHGESYALDGLEERNASARERAIVIHGADYATTDFIEMRKSEKAYVRLGLSHGCPAVSPNTMDLLIELKLTGSLLYNYTVLDSENPQDPNFPIPQKKESGLNEK